MRASRSTEIDTAMCLLVSFALDLWTNATLSSDDHSRVRLLTPVEGSDYINANYVAMPLASRKYICTQGPLRSTSAHFWQMIYEQVSSHKDIHMQRKRTCRTPTLSSWWRSVARTVHRKCSNTSRRRMMKTMSSA